MEKIRDFYQSLISKVGLFGSVLIILVLLTGPASLVWLGVAQYGNKINEVRAISEATYRLAESNSTAIDAVRGSINSMAKVISEKASRIELSATIDSMSSEISLKIENRYNALKTLISGNSNGIEEVKIELQRKADKRMLAQIEADIKRNQAWIFSGMSEVTPESQKVAEDYRAKVKALNSQKSDSLFNETIALTKKQINDGTDSSFVAITDNRIELIEGAVDSLRIKIEKIEPAIVTKRRR